MEKDITSYIAKYERQKEEIDMQKEELAALETEYQKQIKPLEAQIKDLKKTLERKLEPIKRTIHKQEDDLEKYSKNLQVFIKFGDLVQEISDVTGTLVQDINISGSYSYSFSPLNIYGKENVTKEDFLNYDNNPLYPIYLHLTAIGTIPANPNSTAFEFNHQFECHLLDIESDGKTLLDHSIVKHKAIEYDDSLDKQKENKQEKQKKLTFYSY